MELHTLFIFPLAELIEVFFKCWCVIFICDSEVYDLQEGRQTDILIMDFAKAFDKVNYSLLIHKLRYYGIDGKTTRWIQNWISSTNSMSCVSQERPFRNSWCSGYKMVFSSACCMMFLAMICSRILQQTDVSEIDLTYLAVNSNLHSQQILHSRKKSL
jgi:hypothetical protein